MTTHKTITFTHANGVVNLTKSDDTKVGELVHQFGGVCVVKTVDHDLIQAEDYAFQKTKGIAFESLADARKAFIKAYQIGCKRLRIGDFEFSGGVIDSPITYDGVVVGRMIDDGAALEAYDNSPPFLKSMMGKKYKGYAGTKAAIVDAARLYGYDDDAGDDDTNAGEPLLVDWDRYMPDKVINDQDLVNIRGLSALTALSLRLNFVSEKDKSGVNVVLDGRAIALLYCDDDDTAKISWYAGNDKLDGLWDAEATTDQLSCGLGDGGIRRAKKIISGALLFCGV